MHKENESMNIFQFQNQKICRSLAVANACTTVTKYDNIFVPIAFRHAIEIWI